MKIDLTNEQLEELEELKGRPGYKVLQIIRDMVAMQKLQESFNAKDRDLIEKGVVIHETAISTLNRNAGYVEGIDYLIKRIDKAYKERTQRAKNSHS